MIISRFASVRDNHPRTTQLAWGEFAASFGPHDFTHLNKLELPAFSPAEFAPGATRANKNVLRVHAAVLDLDKIRESDVADLLSALDGTAAILYTTWSHPRELAATGLWRLRVIVQLSRPVEADEWAAFWPALQGHFRDLADPQCSDPSRLYFTACQPPGTEDAAEYIVHPGAPLDVDVLLGGPAASAPLPRTVRPISRAVLADFGKRLQAKQPSLAVAVRQVLKGEPFAEAGVRDDTIFRLACALAEQWPDGDPQSIAQHFGPSLDVMAADSPADHFTTDDVVAKIKRQQEQIHAERGAAELAYVTARKARLREAWGNGRDTPYTEQELDAFGVERWRLDSQWIIQYGCSFYLLKHTGSYSSPPRTERDVTANALRELSPAESAGVQLIKTTKQGEIVQKSAAELVRQYGTTADQIALDLNAQKTLYDPTSYTIIEAPCPLRRIEPKHDPAVAKWLEILAGQDKHARLLDWIATVTRLDRPSAALFIEGAPESGKTLLGAGLSRLWTTAGPTALTAAMDIFNDALARCPLVLADETLPQDWQGNGRTAELREFIQARERHLNRKFLPRAPLRGAVRLIIAANNRDLLYSKDHLTASDIDAISERFFYIHAPTDAAVYLKSQDVTQWVEGDAIAAHALHLIATRTVKPDSRFIVAGDCAELHRSLTTGSGLRSSLCHWLASYLMRPEPCNAKGEFFVRTHEGRLLVNAQGLAGVNWDMYPTSTKTPPLSAISKALVGLSHGERARLVHPEGGERINYRHVRTENILAWAKETEFTSEESILNAISDDTSAPLNVGGNVTRIVSA